MSNTSTRPKSALKEVAKTSTGVEQKGDSIKNSRSSDDLHKRATLSPIHHDITIDEHGGDLKGYGNPNSASNTRRHSFNVDLMQKFKYAMVVTGGRSTMLFNWGRAQSEPLLSRPLSSTTVLYFWMLISSTQVNKEFNYYQNIHFKKYFLT